MFLMFFGFIGTNIVAHVGVFGYNDRGNHGGVAQWLEQRAHNLLVAGSNPATPTIRKHRTIVLFNILLLTGITVTCDS